MYGKVFDSIYDGTLYGHWQAIVTMQQLIVLANADGVVDMTPQAISARTSIPLEIITKGLEVLAKPDPYTRTPGEEGRRIVLIDSHRPWGWQLVNYGKYMRLRNMAEKREADRARISEKRKKNKDVAIGSQNVANVAHVYVDVDVSKNNVGLGPDHARKEAEAVLTYLNEQAGREYRPVPANLSLISARLKEGASVDDCKSVIDRKCREWRGGEMDKYLRPATLFNASKFASYVGERESTIKPDL